MGNFVTQTRSKIAAVKLKGAFWAVGKVFSIFAYFFSKLSRQCRNACFIEIWSQITQGKPIDFDSSLYAEINQIIEYYFTKASNSRASIGLLERKVLPNNYMY